VRRMTGRGLGTLVCVLKPSVAGALAALAWSAGLAYPAEETHSVFRTLVRGLEHRASSAGWVSGEAVVQSYCSSEDLAEKLSFEYPGHDRPKEAPNRGEYLVRFRLGQRRWQYEVQALTTPGGAQTWGFGLPAEGLAPGGAPYYRRVTCTDGVCYDLKRSLSKPLGQVYRAQFDLPGALQPPFGMWLGLGTSWRGWSDFLTGEQFRLTSIEKEEWGDMECFHVVRGLQTPEKLGEQQLWIVPQLGFAPVRKESLVIHKDDARVGARAVHTWESHEEQGGCWLPLDYRSDYYRYRRSSQATWLRGERVTFRGLSCSPDPEPPAWEGPFPVGSVLLLDVLTMSEPGQAPLADPLDRMQQTYAPWANAQHRLEEAGLPVEDESFAQQNAEYLRPLEGTELAALKERHGF